MKRLLYTLFSCILLCFMMTFSADAATSGDYGWKQDNTGWYYIVNGSVLKGSWLKDTDGKWYYMDERGYMHTGWLHDSDGIWYYMNPDGSLATGLCNVNGSLYYFSPVTGGPLGAMVTGNQVINGINYYFDPVSGIGTLVSGEQMSNAPSYIPETTNNNSPIDRNTKLAIWGEVQNAVSSFESARHNWMMSVDMITADNTTLYALKSQSRFEKTHEHLQRAIGYCSNYPEMFELKSILQKCDNYIISSGILNSIGEFTKGSYRNAVNFGVDVGHMLTETDIMSELEHASSISKSLSN